MTDNFLHELKISSEYGILILISNQTIEMVRFETCANASAILRRYASQNPSHTIQGAAYSGYQPVDFINRLNEN